jgi:hypothetical protein
MTSLMPRRNLTQAGKLLAAFAFGSGLIMQTPAQATIVDGEQITSAGVLWTVIDCGSGAYCGDYTLSAISGGVEIAYTGATPAPGAKVTPDLAPVLATTSPVSFASFASDDGYGSVIISTDVGQTSIVAALYAGQSSSFPAQSTLYWATNIPYSHAPFKFVTEVPEPASLAVLGVGCAALVGARRRRTAA